MNSLAALTRLYHGLAERPQRQAPSMGLKRTTLLFEPRRKRLG